MLCSYFRHLHYLYVLIRRPLQSTLFPYTTLFQSVDLENGSTQSKAIKTLKSFYKKSDFVKILRKDSLISTNDVINSNNCFISICKSKYKDKIIILSAIDNLIKGGAGQAVQNLNMKFNFPVKTAL